MPVVATAGHVDHGKSTLILALTGRDPDRWEEEKRRGLTIDLGFAWSHLPDGTEVGFVDVPGHERFVKNMLAGVEAVDAALFVVAADEGWMPQSEEHLAVIDLLGIRHGVVALTRADLVDEETLAIAELEVEDRLAGTTLAGSPIIPVAAPEGRGVEAVAAALAAAVASCPPQREDRPRMWVDRSFTIGGAGTVVTGTLVGGALSVGDTLVLWPGRREVRVRSLQTHERAVDRIAPGNRAAANLAGLERQAVERGSMLGRPGDWRATRRFLADLRTVRSLEEPLGDRGAFHLHVGSGDWSARVRLLEGPALEGRGAALIDASADLPIAAGDRLVIRDVGRRAVVAGGVVLDPHPPRRGAAMRAALPLLRSAATPDAVADALLEIRGSDRLEALSADSGGGRPAASLEAGGVAVSASEAARLTAAAAEALETFHDRHPLRAGMPKPDLATRLGIGLDLLAALAVSSDRLADDGPVIRASGFRAELGEAERDRWEAARALLEESGAAPPRRTELGLDTETIHALVRAGSLVDVSAEFVYLPETIDEAVGRLATLPAGFTVAAVRDLLGVTRRHAVPLLEWLDAAGITRRAGDGRVLRPPA
jgi:selenocysteine-specific elongation factor